MPLPPFATFRDVDLWEKYISTKLAPFEADIPSYLKYWYIESRENSTAYPSQGLLTTPYDFLPPSRKAMLPIQSMLKILRTRQYFLELFNHPERILHLQAVAKEPWVAPPAISSPVMEQALEQGRALSIEDLGISVVGSQNHRVSRKDRFVQGPFVKLGRYARSLLVGSAMPDIYGSVYALSTMAQSHCLTSVPRNGHLSDIKRQQVLIKEVWNALSESEVLLNRPASERTFLLKSWRRNIMGVLEGDPDKALKRALGLYEIGVRTFRIYSPEPGLNVLRCLKKLRKNLGSQVEIFVGQVVDVLQGQQLEDSGADGLYIGIGGGGRCITGVRSGSVIDWPMLLWALRGQIHIPVIVEGGASDHIATTLALGATGIGVSRVAGGGTIESPGGMLYCLDEAGRYFKPYGGEASPRTKYLDDKMLPFGIPSFVEGETRSAYMDHLPYGAPTIPFHLFSLTEDIILSLVFRGVTNLADFQAISPSPIRGKSEQARELQNTH
ncbi:MAG: Inosine-5'-monophosphate dehydrogenase [Microgenomates group bacterium GW2011_GWC2_46_7]|nr:MAG: Inosine-5'-monophosphate dehydrogenase [Microgenomates group bacterium GW2011_GWC2_46_7]